MSILIISLIKHLNTYRSLFIISISLSCPAVLSKIHAVPSKEKLTQSLTIKSEIIQINTKHQTYHYLNHVRAEYNNNLLRAKSLTIFIKQSIAYKLEAYGTPAKLKLFDKKNKTYLYAKANKIIAYPKKNQLLLIEQASLKKENKILSAEKISINTKNLNISTVSSDKQLSTLILKAN